MTTTTKLEPTSRELDVPGATITYDVRPNPDSSLTPLFMIGSPMGAAGFMTLSSHFADRTVITYDPRGSERSVKDDVSSPVDPTIHADDLHRVIQDVGLGQVDMFASSGGAVNALALVALHPDDVQTLVAHEPPLAAVLPDSGAALEACRAVARTYQEKGFGYGMAHFIAVASHQGEFDDEYARQPGPDPVMFGMPTDDDGDRSDPLLGQNMITCTHFVPDVERLESAPTRIVVAAGVESGGTMARRCAIAIAERMGVPATDFPSDHGGFLGGEYGQMGDPDAFAVALREVLAG